MGGSVGVESKVGEGSTFSFTLPLPFHHPQLPRPLPAADLNGLRVLIVDDNEVTRRVTHEEITSWGLRNASFSTAEETIRQLHLARAAGDPYHFVIADFQRPGMDGATLASTIKKDPAIRDTLVIILSTIADWQQIRGMQCVDACLVKPVRQSQLFDALVDAWARKLPRAQAAGTARVVACLESAAVARPPVPEHSGLRVLVAEDNAVNQIVAIRMLQSLGVRADTAANGSEAIELLRMVPYDLVLMDCQMPEMNGYEATLEIRRRENAGRRVVIIAMTADVSDRCRAECFRSGMDDFISKPLKVENLCATIARWAKFDKSANQPSTPVNAA
jgi:CheY-like chemotaxis protein